jgi:hypothetical protein
MRSRARARTLRGMARLCFRCDDRDGWSENLRAVRAGGRGLQGIRAVRFVV